MTNFSKRTRRLTTEGSDRTPPGYQPGGDLVVMFNSHVLLSDAAKKKTGKLHPWRDGPCHIRSGGASAL